MKFFEQWARAKFDPQHAPDVGTPTFSGYRGAAPVEEIHEMFRQWDEHGVMYSAGGYSDQPEWWRRDMATCRMLMNVRANMVIREVKAREDKRGH